MIAGLWLESPGVVFSLLQQGKQFTAETKYQHPKAGTIKAVTENMNPRQADPQYLEAITKSPDLETSFLFMDGGGVGVTLKKR